MKSREKRKLFTTYAVSRGNMSEETERLKTAKLKRSPNNEYDPMYRMWVPRTRTICSDGLVRATRTRNEHPTKPPKDSDYARLYRAFSNMRRDGAYAKWNIPGQTVEEYWCNLPDLKQPMITHYECHVSYFDMARTGMSWTKRWECVQDSVFIDVQNGGFEILEKRLTEEGFRFVVVSEVHGKDYDIKLVKLVFRGEAVNDLDCGFTIWNWLNNAIEMGPKRPPKINRM
jgi:hypothetical protein